MQVWRRYIMASVIYQRMLMANISFFHKFDNLPAILNILAYISQTQPEMHLYLNFYVRTHHKNSKKSYVINVHSRWHLAPSAAGLCVVMYLFHNAVCFANVAMQHNLLFVDLCISHHALCYVRCVLFLLYLLLTARFNDAMHDV